jgi:hypothetical protein
MQLGQLIRINNRRWGGIFGGIASTTALIIGQWKLSISSSSLAALVVTLLFLVFFLLLVVLTNLAKVLLADGRGDDAVGNE